MKIDLKYFVGKPRFYSDLQSVASDLGLHCLPGTRPICLLVSSLSSSVVC